MAIQILPRDTEYENLGQGLGTGLNQLLNMKMQQYQQQEGRQYQQQLAKAQQERAIPGLQALFPDMDRNQLLSLASQDPSLLREVYKQKALAPQYSAVSRILGGQQGLSPEQGPGQPGGLDQLMQGSSNMAQPGGQNLTAQLFAEAPQLARQFAPIVQAQESAEHKKKELGLAEKKFESAEQQRIFNMNKDALQKIDSQGEEADNVIRNAENFGKLVKTGKVNSGPWRNLLSKIPGLADVINNPETEAARSYIANRTFNLMKAVGVRGLSDFESRLINTTGPTLLQQPEVMAFNAVNDKIAGEYAKKRYDAKKEVIKQNNNKIPEDILDQVDQKMAKFVPHFKKEYAQNLSKLTNIPLPDINKFTVGQIIRHPITDERLIVQEINGKKSYNKIPDESGV